MGNPFLLVGRQVFRSQSGSIKSIFKSHSRSYLIPKCNPPKPTRPGCPEEVATRYFLLVTKKRTERRENNHWRKYKTFQVASFLVSHWVGSSILDHSDRLLMRPCISPWAAREYLLRPFPDTAKLRLEIATSAPCGAEMGLHQQVWIA